MPNGLSDNPGQPSSVHTAALMATILKAHFVKRTPAFKAASLESFKYDA